MKPRIIPMSALVMVFTLTAACGLSDSATKETNQLNSLSTTVVHKNTSIPFGKVFSGTWDSAVIACPYTPVDALKNAVGSDWKDASKYENLSEGQQIVVLLKDQKVQSVDKSNREKLDLCSSSGGLKKVKPSTHLTISEAKWSDRSNHLVASYK